MAKIFERLDETKSKDLRVLADFITIFCRENHADKPRSSFPVKDAKLRKALGDKEFILCLDCSKLLSHGTAKLLLCPYDPKPMCKKCEAPCYAPGYREKIREIMKFSGIYLIKHGRLDLLVHYMF